MDFLKYDYSDGFKKLIANEEKLAGLLRGISVSSDTNFKKWEEMRSFIAGAINKNGSLLDIGCGNGFLLGCLKEWSKYKIIPYGVDYRADLIVQAKEIFPSWKNNFAVANMREITRPDDFLELGLPSRYDFICWNIWDDWLLDDVKQVDPLRTCFDAVSSKGRLILCFYDSDKNKEIKLGNIKKSGFKCAGLLKTAFRESGKSEWLVWIEKNNNWQLLVESNRLIILNLCVP